MLSDDIIFEQIRTKSIFNLKIKSCPNIREVLFTLVLWAFSHDFPSFWRLYYKRSFMSDEFYSASSILSLIFTVSSNIVIFCSFCYTTEEHKNGSVGFFVSCNQGIQSCCYILYPCSFYFRCADLDKRDRFRYRTKNHIDLVESFSPVRIWDSAERRSPERHKLKLILLICELGSACETKNLSIRRASSSQGTWWDFTSYFRREVV